MKITLLLSIILDVLFLGKKKRSVSTAVNLGFPKKDSPTSHLRLANHQLAFLITLGIVTEDVVLLKNTWGICWNSQMFIPNFWFDRTVASQIHGFCWKICHQFFLDILGSELFHGFGCGSMTCFSLRFPWFPWKNLSILSKLGKCFHFSGDFRL